MIKKFIGNSNRHYVLLAKYWYRPLGISLTGKQHEEILKGVCSLVSGIPVEFIKMQDVAQSIYYFCEEVEVDWQWCFDNLKMSNNPLMSKIQVMLSAISLREDLIPVGKVDKKLKNKINKMIGEC